MEPTDPLVGLLGLPEELILHIVSSYKALRSDEPQSQAFRYKSREKARQRENGTRQAALHSLCLTSRTLNRITTPVLYSSFVGSTTLHGVGLLRSFFTAVTARKELGGYIEYVENRLSDYLGNDLLHDMDFHDADDIVPEYFVKLAIIIRSSPNIQQLCVVSIESIDISLWKHLLPDSLLRWDIAGHGFLKLHTLALQTNTIYQYAMDPDAADFSTIFHEMSAAPRLSQFRASGLVFGRTSPVWRPYANLRYLDLTEVMSAFNDIDQILQLCDHLVQFKCHWAYLTVILNEPFEDLLPSIVKHKETLQTLWLVLPTIEIYSPPPPPIQFSSLPHLTALKEARLCNLFVPDRYTYQGAAFEPPPISSLAPPAVEHLTIMYSFLWDEAPVYSFYVLSSLWRLVRDCAHSLPYLRELIIQFQDGALSSFEESTNESQGDVDLLTARFRNLGVQFMLVAELDVLA